MAANGVQLLACHAVLILIFPYSKTQEFHPHPVFENSLTLSPPTLTDRGTWKHWDYCDPGTYVIGMRLKSQLQFNDKDVHPSKKITDNFGLSGVELVCGMAGMRNGSQIISSDIGREGLWTRIFYCDGLVMGMRLKQEPWDAGDLVGASNLRLICSGGNETLQANLQFQPGVWSEELRCLRKQAVCGIQTQTQQFFENNSADAVGINNMKLQCCKILSEEETCFPAENWELIFDYDNRDGLQPAKYTFIKSVGVGRSRQRTNGNKNGQEVGGGANEDSEGNTILMPPYNSTSLRQRFAANILGKREWEYNWLLASTDTWNIERTTNVEVLIEPGHRTTIYQIVGICGDFIVRPDKIYQNGTFLDKKVFEEENQKGAIFKKMSKMFDTLFTIINSMYGMFEALKSFRTFFTDFSSNLKYLRMI